MIVNIMRIMNYDPVIFTKALADETRQEILLHLCCVWLSVNDVVDKLDGKVNQPTVSHHLKKLEEAGLVTVRQEGRQRFYTLNQEQMTACCGVLMRKYQLPEAEKLIPVGQIPVIKS
jgi:ArsR family transcriptional regulator, arsenate/arsenite/antimonite-responsive transcriptional repressor